MIKKSLKVLNKLLWLNNNSWTIFFVKRSWKIRSAERSVHRMCLQKISTLGLFRHDVLKMKTNHTKVFNVSTKPEWIFGMLVSIKKLAKGSTISHVRFIFIESFVKTNHTKDSGRVTQTVPLTLKILVKAKACWKLCKTDWNRSFDNFESFYLFMSL